jgi:lipooligosaccharide transport system permease protein
MSSLLPSPSWVWIAIWRRQLLVWRKLIIPSLVGNFGDPLLYLLALGYGLGRFVGTMAGMPYIDFLASGIVCSSAMNTATFEGLFGAFTRMTTQQTWTGMLAAPLDVDDIVLAEMIWAGSKSVISAGAILVVASALGAVHGPGAVLVLPMALLVGTCFGGMALVVTAVAESYDFFMYYLTLAVTPMALFCGVFFPLDGLPAPLRVVSTLLPLTHAVETIRPLMTGHWPTHALLHVAVLGTYTFVAYVVATFLIRRRLLA